MNASTITCGPDYYRTLTYRGRGSTVVHLRVEWCGGRRCRWYFSFARSLEVGPFPTKFDALVAAAHACRRSAKDMNWEPVDPP